LKGIRYKEILSVAQSQKKQIIPESKARNGDLQPVSGDHDHPCHDLALDSLAAITGHISKNMARKRPFS
jgi:hypothetical protein